MAKQSGAPVLRGYGFRGMNNLPGVPGVFADVNKIISPQILVNADVADGNVLRRRKGYTREIPLSNCHSLWGGNFLLCVADGLLNPRSLYRIDGATMTELCEVPGPRFPLSYLEINDAIYISNPYFSAIYKPGPGDVLGWGAPLPEMPTISAIGGSMPPGVYLLTYTQVRDGQQSGNGPILEVSRTGDSFGIQLNNLPSFGNCYVTHPNGEDFFKARVVDGQITSLAPDVQPLETFNVIPPPKFSAMVYAHGRIWGAIGKKVFYSDPTLFSWFRARNFMPFLEDIVLLAPVHSGLFINSRDNTWFVDGTEVEKMNVRRMGDGAVPGTLAFAQVEGTGYEISKRLSQVPSPIWMSKRGMVVGTQTGHLVHLTEGKLRIPTRGYGAAIYRVRNGIPQYLTSMWGPPLTGEDETLRQIFSIGRLYLPQPISQTGEGGWEIS